MNIQPQMIPNRTMGIHTSTKSFDPTSFSPDNDEFEDDDDATSNYGEQRDTEGLRPFSDSEDADNFPTPVE